MKNYRNEIIEFVKEIYDIGPEFLWSKYPSYAIFRNKRNKKWFGAVMSIPKEKLGLNGKEEVEVLNIKCEPFGIIQLLDENNGFLPAYHMNKNYWISVLLDGSVRINRVKNLLQMSYNLIEKKR